MLSRKKMGMFLSLVVLLGMLSLHADVVKAFNTNDRTLENQAGLFLIEFIANDLQTNEGTGWSQDTRISKIVKLHDETENVIGLTFELATLGNLNNGYVTIYLGDEDEYVIHEFSYTERPLYYENVGEDFDKVYYTDGLEYFVSKNNRYFEYEAVEVEKERIKEKFSQIKVEKEKSRENESGNEKKLIKEKVKKFKFDIDEWMLGYKGQLSSADGSYAGITAPYDYVTDRYGTGWSLKSSKYVSYVPALLQSNFTGGPDNCTITSLTAVFKHYQSVGYSRIPSNVTTIYNDVRTIALKHGYKDSGGTPPTKISTIAKEVWAKYGYTSGNSSSLYVWSWSDFKRESDNNRPYLINMANGYYKNHTVTAIGYLSYGKSGRSDVNLIQVRDNWTTSTRYIDKNAFSCCGSITRIYP